MSAWIEASKKELLNIVKYVKDIHPLTKIQISFIAYRDFVDKKERLDILPFTDNFEMLTKFINRQEAKGKF